METTFTKINFSIIGNCALFIKNNGQELRNIFKDYEVSTRDENLPDGTTATSLLFKKGAVSLRFTPARVDCEILASSKDTQLKDYLDYACDFFERLKSLSPPLIGNRIAIVAQCFIDNTQCKAVEYLTGKMGLGYAFGICNELHFKINSPKIGFERLNCVLNVDMGEAKNNKTGEVTKVLIASIDVNTLAENKAERFTPANARPLFTELLKIAETQMQTLKKF